MRDKDLTNLTGRSPWLPILAVLGGLLGWAYWPTFTSLVERWWDNSQYSHGFLVPVFVLAVLYVRRDRLQGATLEPSAWALPFIAAGVGLHLAGAVFYFDWASDLSLLPILAGITLAVAGLGGLRWAWPAIAYLVFMLPLPWGVETALALPLQRLATVASVYALQTLGFAAVAEGNLVLMEQSRLNVAEACNGLGMMMMFFALSTAVAMFLDRPLGDRVVIVLSAIPIALLTNVIRITATGIVTELVDQEFGEGRFHDLAGLAMPLVGLALLWVEVELLSRLLVDPPAEDDEPAFSFVDAGVGKPA